MDGLSSQDQDLVARTMLSEAGDQGDEGLAAVAHVIRNRTLSGDPDFPTDVSGVIHQRNAFTAWNNPRGKNNPMDFRSNDPQLQHARDIAGQVFSGQSPDPTNGATYYADVPLAKKLYGKTPSFSKYPQTAQIGAHTFYNPNPQSAALSYSQTQPDLLNEWLSKPTGTQAPQVQSDLLNEWLSKPAEPQAQPTAQPVPPIATAQGPESATQFVARQIMEHQAPTYSDLAIRAGGGALLGISDIASTLGQGITYLGQKTGLMSPETVSAVQQRIAANQAAADLAAATSGMATAGRIGGQIAGTAPLIAAGGAGLGAGAEAIAPGITAAISRAPLIARLAGTGAGIGAASAGLTSAVSPEPVTQQMLQGAGAGAAMGPLGYGASALGAGVRRGLFGAVAPETAQLAQTARNQFGIPITAGQISSSPFVRFADSVMQRLPFTGYGARTAEQQGTFNRAIASTFGESADAITPDVLDRAEDRIGNVFDSVAARTPIIHADAPFYNRMIGIVNDANSVLPESDVRPITNQIQNIIGTIQNHTLSGDTYQALTRRGTPLDRLTKSTNPNVKFYAQQMRDTLDDAMERSAPPDAVQDLLEARRQWKALKTIEPLADKAPTGDISPALLQNAANKSYTYNRDADLRQLGRIGQRFIKEPPSSGTAERLLTMGMAGTALGALGVGGYEFDPEHFQRNLALAGAGLLGGRAASAAIRSNALASSLIRSGLGTSQPSLNLLSRAAPAAALIYRNRAAGQ